MESDSLEFLGIEHPNDECAVAEDAIDLFEPPDAMSSRREEGESESECCLSRKLVPDSAEVTMLMCKMERLQKVGSFTMEP